MFYQNIIIEVPLGSLSRNSLGFGNVPVIVSYACSPVTLRSVPWHGKALLRVRFSDGP